MIAARDNPFSTERSEALLTYEPRWIGTTWASLLARLEEHSFRAALVGPHGSGKTTCLEELAVKLRARGIPVISLFLNRDSPPVELSARLSSLDPDAVILFDGAEQLNWRSRRRLLRCTVAHRGLIVTAHRPTSLPTLLQTRVTPEILQRCVERLDPRFPLDRHGAETLFRRHAGNIRHALLECYDEAGRAGRKGLAKCRALGPS